jgi:hypothetical protein
MQCPRCQYEDPPQAKFCLEELLTAGEAMGLARVQAQAIRRPRRGLSRYFLPVKNSLMFSLLNLAPSTMVWPMPVYISLNPGPT